MKLLKLFIYNMKILVFIKMQRRILKTELNISVKFFKNYDKKNNKTDCLLKVAD